MAQVHPTIDEVNDINRFESLLRDAWEKPWWRELVSKMRERQLVFLHTLVEGVENTRHEDKVRGHVEELNWMLSLDALGKQLNEERYNGRGQTSTDDRSV